MPDPPLAEMEVPADDDRADAASRSTRMVRTNSSAVIPASAASKVTKTTPERPRRSATDALTFGGVRRNATGRSAK